MCAWAAAGATRCPPWAQPTRLVLCHCLQSLTGSSLHCCCFFSPLLIVHSLSCPFLLPRAKLLAEPQSLPCAHPTTATALTVTSGGSCPDTQQPGRLSPDEVSSCWVCRQDPLSTAGSKLERPRCSTVGRDGWWQLTAPCWGVGSCSIGNNWGTILCGAVEWLQADQE